MWIREMMQNPWPYRDVDSVMTHLAVAAYFSWEARVQFGMVEGQVPFSAAELQRLDEDWALILWRSGGHRLLNKRGLPAADFRSRRLALAHLLYLCRLEKGEEGSDIRDWLAADNWLSTIYFVR